MSDIPRIESGEEEDEDKAPLLMGTTRCNPNDHHQHQHPCHCDCHPSDTEHENGNNKTRRMGCCQSTVAVIVGLAFPILLPFLHMLLYKSQWGREKVTVMRNSCSCDCWDMVFKGNDETGWLGYKNVYFNSTRITLYMWIITIFFVIAVYEAFKYVVILMFKGRLRMSMALLFVLSVYPHYHAWWTHWDFWNDEYYQQWNRQLFFTLTQLTSTIAVMTCLDTKKQMTPGPLLIIGSVAAFDMVLIMWDQLFPNAIIVGPMAHLVIRDITFLVTYIIHFLVVWMEMKLVLIQLRTTVPMLLKNPRYKWVIGGMGIAMLLYLILAPLYVYNH